MRSGLAYVLALVVSGSLVLSILHAGNQVSPGPLKIGVVDLFKVVDGYQKKKDREAELNKVRDASAAQLKDLQKKIEGMTSEMELLDKNSPDSRPSGRCSPKSRKNSS